MKNKCLVKISVFLIAALLMLSSYIFATDMPTDTQIKFQVSLPEDISKTDFSQVKYASYEEGEAKSDYVMKGVPFLYNNTTYLPVRDVAEALGISVTYDNDDRFVTLNAGDLSMFISPNMTNIGGYYYEVSNATGIVTCLLYTSDA